jgi:hypothetical protein
MDPISIVAILIVGGVITAIAKGLSSQKRKVQNNLRDKRPVSIDDFEHGDVNKIIGQALKYEKTIIAPLSDRECLFYQIIIQQRKDDKWVNIIKDEKYVDFLVHDGERTAYIVAKDIKGYLVKDLEMNSSFFKPATAKMIQYLESKGKTHKQFLGMAKKLRYYEGIVHIGEMVAVKGRGEWELQPNPDEQKLIMRGEPEIELYLSDDKDTFG